MLSPVLYAGRYDMSELSFEFAGFGNYQPFPSVGQLVTMIPATFTKPATGAINASGGFSRGVPKAPAQARVMRALMQRR